MDKIFKHISGNQFKLKESAEDFFISKEEEDYAYRYLIKKIIPDILEKCYYKYIKSHPSLFPEKKYPRISLKDITDNLKKIRQDKEYIVYESVINDYVEFTFSFRKRYSEKIHKPYIIVGVLGSIKDEWAWYDIE